MSQQKLIKFLGDEIEEKESSGLSTEDWTFKDANTKIYTHGLHPYPARMIPQVARKIIKLFSPEVHKTLNTRDFAIYDPFCGSGTVLVEAVVNKFDAYGTDINPLATLLAKVKATPINPKELTKAFIKLKENQQKNWDNRDALKSMVPTFNRKKDIKGQNPLEFWFKPNVIRRLNVLKVTIWEGNFEPEIFNFLKACFSYTVRKSSNNRQGEFKLYRIPKKELDKWNPNVFEIFDNKVNEAIKQMKEFCSLTSRNSAVVDTWCANAIKFNPNDYGINKPIGLIITSPPYGDHRTTVAYGQFSQFSSIWLEGEDSEQIIQVDREGLGGKEAKIDWNHLILSLPSMIDTMEKISIGDHKAQINRIVNAMDKIKGKMDALGDDDLSQSSLLQEKISNYKIQLKLSQERLKREENQWQLRRLRKNNGNKAQITQLNQQLSELSQSVEALQTQLNSKRKKDLVAENPRLRDVYAFNFDYYEALSNFFEILAPGGYCCLVTGNRSVRRITIQTHQISKELGELIGFRYVKTFPREIPTKTMPWENAPENISGERNITMATEHITILRKPIQNKTN